MFSKKNEEHYEFIVFKGGKLFTKYTYLPNANPILDFLIKDLQNSSKKEVVFDVSRKKILLNYTSKIKKEVSE